MNAYVLTQMEMVGEGEQAHVVTINRGVTLCPTVAQDWSAKGVDFDFDTFPLSSYESAQLGVSEQTIQALHEATAAAKDLGESAEAAARLLRELK